MFQVADLEKIPDLEEFLVLVMSGNTSIFSESVIDLLYFILTSPKFKIESVPKSKFNEVLNLSKKTTVKSTSMPTHIFKINYVGKWTISILMLVIELRNVSVM